MLCVSLDGMGVWERMDTYICMAESFCCSPETITTLLIGCTPTEKGKFFFFFFFKEGCILAKGGLLNHFTRVRMTLIKKTRDK